MKTSLKSLSVRSEKGIWITVIEWWVSIDSISNPYPFTLGVVQLANGEFVEPEYNLFESVPIGTERFGPLLKGYHLDVETPLLAKTGAQNSVASEKRQAETLERSLQVHVDKFSQWEIELGRIETIEFSNFCNVLVVNITMKSAFDSIRRQLYLARDGRVTMRERTSIIEDD